MTKKELIEYLEPFSDEVDIYIDTLDRTCDIEPNYVPVTEDRPAYISLYIGWERE